MLNITDYQTLVPRRPVDLANNTYTDLDPIDAVVFLNEPQPVMTDRGKRFVQNGILRVRRGGDGLQEGDEITLPEGVFGVVSGSQNNRRHSMTGADFGWDRYSIRKGG
ncbi:hypothetical protein [Mycolicibacterium brisbanense]